MSDVTPEILRSWADWYENLRTEDMPGPSLSEALMNAADQIEKLQQQRDRWHQIADELVLAAEVQQGLLSKPFNYNKETYANYIRTALVSYSLAQEEHNNG